MMLFQHTKVPSATGKKNHSTMNAALRRAFTITELVIVIAVIAILAAVLIPTFTNLINRANESADIQMVKNLNTILSSEEALGNRADTIEEALEQALDGGYKVENLTPTSDGNEIVWDATNNRFALVDSDGNKVFGDALTPDTISGQEYWKITNDISKTSNTNFSWYLTEDALTSEGGTSEKIEIISSANLNLSAFTDLKTVTISTTEADAVVNLTTNSEDVKISVGTTTAANTATVNLYGTAGTVGAINSKGAIIGGQFGMNSLHVYGTVDKILVRSGKIVAESGSSIGTIICTDYVTISPVSIILEEGASISNLGSTTYDNLGFVSTLNNIITGDKSSINIIRERIFLTMMFGGGLGTADDPYVINTEDQLFFASCAGKNSPFSSDINYWKQNTIYFKLGADITLNKCYTTSFASMNLDLAGYTITNKVIQIDSDDPAVALYSAFKVISATNLTIEDSVGSGGIVTPNAYISEETLAVDYLFDVIGSEDICSLTINGGTFSGVISVAQVGYSSSITVNGGTFSALIPYEQTGNIYYVLNKLDGSAATITVNGGRFKNFDPSNAKTDPSGTSAPISYLGAGCVSTKDDSIAGETWWVVTK